MKAVRSNARGFTLIEILSVVIIIGVISAVIIPQIGSRDDQRIASAARALTADLLYAQNRAIALQVRHYVVFNTATNTYQVVADSGSGTPGGVITHPVNGTPYTVALNTGYLTGAKFTTVSFDGNTTVAFDAMGVPYSYSPTTGTAALVSGSVVIGAGQNKLTVVVAPYSGEITVH